MDRYAQLTEFARRRDWTGVETEAHRLRNAAVAAWFGRLWARVMGKASE